MITAITPTGDRRLAFALCQLWMKNQSRKVDQWIVVDDGIDSLERFVPMTYVRRDPIDGETKPTLNANLKAAIPHILGDQIIIIEDDEYYSPDYVARMSAELDHHLVVGIMRSKYYHLPTGRYLQIGNAKHASLAETGFQSSFLPTFSASIVGDVYLDMRLWRAAGHQGHLFFDDGASLYVGIKGLPGRTGIGAGHRASLYHAIDSHDRGRLKGWIPKDYGIYLDVLNGSLTGENYASYFRAEGLIS